MSLKVFQRFEDWLELLYYSLSFLKFRNSSIIFSIEFSVS